MPTINTHSVYSSEQVRLHQTQGDALANVATAHAGSVAGQEFNFPKRVYSGLLAVATLAMFEAAKDLEPRVRG